MGRITVTGVGGAALYELRGILAVCLAVLSTALSLNLTPTLGVTVPHGGHIPELCVNSKVRETPPLPGGQASDLHRDPYAVLPGQQPGSRPAPGSPRPPAPGPGGYGPCTTRSQEMP